MAPRHHVEVSGQVPELHWPKQPIAEPRTAPMAMGMRKRIMALAAFPATAAAAVFVVAAFAAGADAEWGIQRAEADEGGE